MAPASGVEVAGAVAPLPPIVPDAKKVEKKSEQSIDMVPSTGSTRISEKSVAESMASLDSSIRNVAYMADDGGDDAPPAEDAAPKSSAWSDRDIHNGAPEEFEDGRMGAEIATLIEDITSHRDLLRRHSKADNAQLKAVESEIELLDFRIFKADDRIEKRSLAKEKIYETRIKVQDAFNLLVNKTNTLANILEPMTEEEYKFVPEPDTAMIKEPVKHTRKEAQMTTSK